MHFHPEILTRTFTHLRNVVKARDSTASSAGDTRDVDETIAVPAHEGRFLRFRRWQERALTNTFGDVKLAHGLSASDFPCLHIYKFGEQPRIGDTSRGIVRISSSWEKTGGLRYVLYRSTHSRPNGSQSGSAKLTASAMLKP